MSAELQQNRPAARRSLVAAASLAAVGSALSWLVVTSSLPSYLAGQEPRQALAVAPYSASANEGEAERDLAAIRQAYAAPAGTLAAPSRANASGSPGPLKSDAEISAALERVAARASQLLVRDQLSATALRMLAEVAYFKSDQQRATTLIEASARRNLRETIAVYHWMMNSLQTGRYAEALQAAETLIRTRPEFGDVGFALIAKLAEMERTRSLVTSRLVDDPSWRFPFLTSITRYITDARTPLHVMVALKDAGKPPVGRELTDYLRFLLEHGFYEIAHFAWLQFLTPDQVAIAGFLYNGDFQHAPSGSPMDWFIKSGIGAQVAILPHGAEGDDRGLRIDLGPGRVQFGEVMQSLLLPSGNYVLKGQIKGEVNGRRGLRWQLTCGQNPAVPIGETQMLLGLQAAWRNFEVPFTVPKVNCRSQMFRLVLDARFAAEQFVTGTVWYDKLSIARQ